MGTNDREPTGSARLQPWKNREPRSLFTWADVPAKLISELVQSASIKGAYIGFGNVTDGTALVIYVKFGRLSERVIIETKADIQPAFAFVENEYLGGTF